MTIADYCAAMERGEIETNSEYQRSDKVWPPAARSFLIESILIGYPIPKIFLFQKLDLKSKKTVKEIVDGQQRSKAILDFFHNELVISGSSEIEALAGKRYSELSDDFQGSFLNYQLAIDLFVSVTPAQIREAFRRLNSYTVPLNPEELRHAEYQGVFKWFIYRLTREFEETFLALGVMKQKNIIRMQDTKLLAEYAHALLNGVQTTKAKDLDKLYLEFDREFPHEVRIRQQLEESIRFIVEMPEIHNGPLMKPYLFYSLLLAVTQSLRPEESLAEVFIAPQPYVFNRDVVVANLTGLAAALDSEAPEEAYIPFVLASAARTNVDKQRKTRVEWLGKALLPELL